MIHLSSLSLSLNDHEILHDVNLELQHNEWMAIIGPNGAGKTSLIKCLVQIYANYSGNLFFENQDLRKLSFRERAKLFSYVPQVNSDFDTHYRIWDLLEFSQYSYTDAFGGLDQSAKERGQELIEEYALQDCLETPLMSLSGGERQRAMLVAALFQKSKVIVLDEPTSFLDPAHQDDLILKLKNLKAQGQQVIFVTHDINLAKSLCDRILGMKGGRIQFYEKSEDVKIDSLNRLFDKEFETFQLNNKEHIAPVNYFK